MIQLAINKKSNNPIYRQIYEQIIMLINNHSLAADYCLPSIRFVAKELQISVISVKNAYEMLENEGYIYTIAGKGCFVSKQTDSTQLDDLITQKAKELIDFCNIYNIEPIQIFDKIKTNPCK